MSSDILFFTVAGLGSIVVILGSIFIGTSNNFSKMFDKKR